MAEVANQEYYHINKYNSADKMMKVGQVYEFGKTSNLFWGFYENVLMRYPEPPYSGLYAEKLAQDHFNSAAFSDLQLTRKVFDFERNAIKDLAMFIRELVFEEIRRDKYPELPCRRSCIWVCRKESIKNWIGWLEQPGLTQRVLRIVVTGKVHTGCQEYLYSDSMNYTQYRQNAVAYWSGESVGKSVYEETIACGQVNVLENVTSEYMKAQ